MPFVSLHEIWRRYTAQVHAEGKSLDRAGNAEYETDALLSQTAAITIGYSGAELENLLNEAAILTVRPLCCPSLLTLLS